MSDGRPNRLGALVLDALAKVWPSPVKVRDARIGGTGTEYSQRYTVDQFMTRVRNGVRVGDAMPPLWGKTVLEIGCGHGGITCYLAAIGARRVVGVDINVDHVAFGRRLAEEIGGSAGAGPLPISFVEMDARRLGFGDSAFDVVWADSVFEHFESPEAVMAEAARVLRPGGILLVPTFSSIFSKYGLHLKTGLKLPWANLLFDEATIVEALRRQATRRPELYDAYPGLRGDARRVRDVRRYHDLNDMTYAAFRRMGESSGLRLKSFRVHATLLGQVLRRVFPRIENTRVLDVLSTGAAAVLEKPLA